MSPEALWAVVIGLSILLYSILDGFDLGVGALHLFARNDTQRRIFLNAIGPVWDGNEVWIVIIMGGLFAGFPNAYATLFSGFYSLMMVLIAGLVFRAVAIEFRSKQPSAKWRSLWDVVFCLASTLIAFVLGLIMGNTIQGIPIDSHQDFVGTFASLFGLYPILIGLLVVSLFAMHGATYLYMKTEGETHETVRTWIMPAIRSFVVFYLLASLATVLIHAHMVERLFAHPTLFVFPALAFLAICTIPYQVQRGAAGLAFLSSSVAIALLLIVFGLGIFPVLIRSTLDPDQNSLTVYNSASSHETLWVLLTIAAIGVPLVLAYGYWIYRIFRGKVRLDSSSY
jgi:cytochrome d ubiquinol oxidase subunit II